jgi:hypothetical protein
LLPLPPPEEFESLVVLSELEPPPPLSSLPSETVSVTVLPELTLAPPLGDELMTWPIGTVLLYVYTVEPSDRPALRIALTAVCSESPST